MKVVRRKNWAAPVAAAALGLCTAAHAADWPQWRGPRRDGRVPEDQWVPAALPAELSPAWKIPVAEGYSSPVVAGRPPAARVYYSDLQEGREVMHALDAATGQELWSAPVDESFKDDWGVGPRCTPVVDGGLVFAQSCRGELQALRADSGALRWRRHYVKDFGAVFMGETGPAAGATRHGNTGAPLIDGDHLIAQAGGLAGASLVCLDKTSGDVLWKSQNDTAGNAAPVLANLGGVRQVISFTAAGLIAVNAADGALLWRVPLTTRLGRHIITPVVVENRVIVGSFLLGLVAIEVTREGAGFRAETCWTNKDLATNFSSPVAAEGYVYGIGPQQNLYCAEARTGRIAWSQAGLIRGSAERAFATLLGMGRNILLLSDSGELVLFAAKPDRCEIVSRVQACGVTWCAPAYADGRLYLRDARNLLCVKLAP